MKPHKWHKEIKAWADGAEIEFLNDEGNWVPKNNQWGFNEDIEYRIKPQPKEPMYAYAWLVKDSEQIEFYADKPEDVLNDDWHQYIGKIKLEQDDGNT